MNLLGNIEQYGYYLRFISRVPLQGKIHEVILAKAKYAMKYYPEIKFSDCNENNVLRIRLPFLVFNPFVSDKIITDLAEISQTDLNDLREMRAVLLTKDSADGKYKRGDIVSANMVLTKWLKDEKWVSGEYAVAYKLYCKNYYRFNAEGNYCVDEVPPKVQDALDELYEEGLTAEDVFIYDIFGPTEMFNELRLMKKGISDGDGFTDYYYSIQSGCRMTDYFLTHGSRNGFYKGLFKTRNDVFELYRFLGERGMEFESNSKLKNSNS